MTEPPSTAGAAMGLLAYYGAMARLGMLSRRDVLGRAFSLAAGAVLPWSLWRASPSEVEAARRAERWIARARVKTAAGVTWPADPRKPEVIDRAFYNGTPGIVLFLLELHAATRDVRVLEEARLGADDLVASIPTYTDAGLYTGLVGVAFVLAQLREAGYREAAKFAMRRVGELPVPESTDVISGSAGIGLTQLEFGDTEAAVKHSQRLVALGQPEHGGLKWAISPSIKNLYPNFSHGTAGVSYFLATVYERTKERALLDAALAGVRYLDAVAVGKPAAYKVFHHEPDGEDLFYLSWCHGPVGTARLFYRLYKATGERAWMDRVHQCARGIIDAGVPEVRSPGYWNNVSQCCGDAGVGEFFVSLCGIERRAEYVRMVERIEAHLMARATEDGDGLKWIQAENRVQPELLVAQTGFMQGAAGVGTFFLRADGMRSGRRPVVRMPDSPFG